MGPLVVAKTGDIRCLFAPLGMHTAGAPAPISWLLSLSFVDKKLRPKGSFSSLPWARQSDTSNIYLRCRQNLPVTPCGCRNPLPFPGGQPVSLLLRSPVVHAGSILTAPNVARPSLRATDPAGTGPGKSSWFLPLLSTGLALSEAHVSCDFDAEKQRLILERKLLRWGRGQLE